MLGYIRTDNDELRMREYRFYRALYCGLCHRMGKCTGQCSRLTLSYDFAFLAAVRLSLTGETPILKKQRCFLHPLRKRPTVQPCQALDLCADASALLCYHKTADDLFDERGLKKLRARLLRPLLSPAYRRAKKRLPELNRTIQDHLNTLAALERSPEISGADPLAEQFGILMGEVFSYGLDGANARIASNLGRAIGHWIYLADAADDFEEDQKKGRFNPYLRVFGSSPTEHDWETVRLALTAHLIRAEQAISLIDNYPAPELREILYNILYCGLVRQGEQAISRNCCDRTKKERDDHDN